MLEEKLQDFYFMFWVFLNKDLVGWIYLLSQ